MQRSGASKGLMCALMRIALCAVLVFGIAPVPCAAYADEAGVDEVNAQSDAQDASSDTPDGESGSELAPEEGIADDEPSEPFESEPSSEHAIDEEYDDASEEPERSQDESVEPLETQAVDDGEEALEEAESEDEDADEEDEAEEEEEPISIEEAEELTGIDASGEGVDYVAGELLVTFADGTTTTVAADAFQEAEAVAAEDAADGELVAADIVGDEIVSDIGLDPVLSVPVAEDATVVQAMAQMMEDPNVVDVQPNYIFYEMDEDGSDEAALDAQLVVNDPLAANSQWGLTRVDAYRAWNLACCDNGVAVAVIDSGCTLDHEDLQGNIVASVGYATSNSVAYEIDDLSDVTGHGTHVAGIVSAVADNGIGIAGVSHNADLVIVKAGTASGTFSNKSLFAAYNYILSHQDEYGIRVVNMSMGISLSKYVEDERYTAWFDESGNYKWDVDKIGLCKYIDRANEAGILTVCAACNVTDGQPAPAYPSDYDGAISVMNLQSDDTIAPLSNSNVAGTTEFTPNATKDICAPGSNIYSTTRNGGYGYMGGTSMAAPFVSGIAALCFAADPSLTPYAVMEILESTADDLGNPGWDTTYGYGCVNAHQAIRSLVSIDISSAQVAVDARYYYTGSPIKPSPVVTLGDATLRQDVDYSVTYEDNVKVGTATVKVTGEGDYAGTAMGTFSVYWNTITKNVVNGAPNQVELRNGYDAQGNEIAGSMHAAPGTTVVFRTIPQTGMTLKSFNVEYDGVKHNVTNGVRRVRGTGLPGSMSEYAFTMPDADAKLNAEFTTNQTKYLITKNVTGSGSVMLVGSDGQVAQKTSDVEKPTMSPTAGRIVYFKVDSPMGTSLKRFNVKYTYVDINGTSIEVTMNKGNGISKVGSNVYCFVMPNASVTLNCEFSK